MHAPRGNKLTRRCLRLTHYAVGACLFTLGCGVDERTLSLSAGSTTGSVNPPVAGASEAPLQGSDQAAPPAELPVCVYGSEVSQGCETLVTNPGFATAITPWKAEPGLLSAWEQSDATALEESGSIRVVNFLHGEADGVAPGAAVQCLPARAGKTYDVAGDVLIREGQGAGTPLGEGEGMTGPPYTGKAGLSIFFFGRAGCLEGSIGNFDSPHTNEVGTWVHSVGSGVAPQQTKSMAIRLNTLMPFRENKFEALFDNVLVRER